MSGALILLAGCGGTSSSIVSCQDFMKGYQDLGNPEIAEMVEDAYLAKFPDRASVSGGTLMANLTNVHEGCEADPDTRIDQFIESSDPTGADSADETESSVSAPPDTPPFKAKFWLEMDLEQSDGGTANQRMELGKLAAAEAFVAPAGFAGLTTACEVNYQRDAVIPGKIIVRSTTNRFPVSLHTGVEMTRPILAEGEYGSMYYRGIVTDIAQSFSNGEYTCQGEGESSSPTPAEFELSPSQIGRHKFLVVVHDYYSPKYPSGDKEDLAYMRFGFFSAAAAVSGADYTCLSSSAPLDGETVRPDGGSITEEAYDATDLPAC